MFSMHDSMLNNTHHHLFPEKKQNLKEFLMALSLLGIYQTLSLLWLEVYIHQIVSSCLKLNSYTHLLH